MSPDDLSRILDELGQRLGPTGEHVFALAVRQVYIDSILGVITTGLLLLGITITVIWCARLTKRRWDAQVALYAEGKGKWSSIRSGPDMDDYAMPWIFGGMVAAFVGIFAALGFVTSLSSLLNPEYAALRAILGAISR